MKRYVATMTATEHDNEKFARPTRGSFDVAECESVREARCRTDMTLTDRIEINPRVMLGKPVVRGTRIPVELLLRKLSEGASESELVDAYPRLTREDIQAAIRYAADTLAHEEVIFVHAAQDDPRS